MLHRFPKQRLSYKEKSKDDFQWAKDTVDFILQNGTTIFNSDYSRKLSNYQLFNNIINQQDFERECNPLGIDVNQIPTAVMPYNKTYNKIQVLLGEELKRRFKFKTVLVNSDGIRSKLESKNLMLRQILESRIQEAITKMAGITNSSENAPMNLEELERYYATTYLESREILMSKILKYLMNALSIKEKMNDAFKHALLSGEEHVYVGTLNNTPILDVLNPLGVFYHKSGDVKYIQDSLFAGYRCYLTSAEVLDKYGQYLSKEDLDKIDNTDSNSFPQRDYYNMTFDDFNVSNSQGSYGDHHTNDFLVQHVEWVSQKRVGFLKFKNEFGDIQEDIVSEDFEHPEYAKKIVVTKEFNKKCTYYTWMDNGIPYSIEYAWIPEVWTATKIGDNIFTLIGPKQVQFRSIDNQYKVKLGYHGLVYSAMNASPISLMDRMKPFQYLYFIVMDKLKKFIAKDVGRVFHFDTSMVDPKLGWEKTLYYLKEMNIDFFNPLQNAEKPGWSQRGKVSSSTDLSQAQHIMNYISLLDALDQQISDVAGVNRQREGQATPGEAVTNAQSNIQMSSNITEIFFKAHDTLWTEILTSLAQNAQVAYKSKGLLTQFILDDQSISTLEINPESLVNADFGIFLTDASREEEIFQTLQQWGQALIQNDKATFSDMIKMLKTNSTEELESIIEQAEVTRQNQLQQQQQQDQQLQLQLQQNQQEFELEKQARDHDNKILIAEIDSLKFQRDQDINDNNIPDQFELEKFRVETKLKERKLDLEEKKINKMTPPAKK